MGTASILTGFGFIEWLIVGFIATNSILCGVYALHRGMRRMDAAKRGANN